MIGKDDKLPPDISPPAFRKRNPQEQTGRRRKDGADIDPFELLGGDKLSLADDLGENGKHKPFNPYDKGR